jgi:hypothetical protein
MFYFSFNSVLAIRDFYFVLAHYLVDIFTDETWIESFVFVIEEFFDILKESVTGGLM